MIERVRSGWEELQSLNHDSCPTHDLTVCLLLRLAVGRDDRVGHAHGVGTGYAYGILLLPLQFICTVVPHGSYARITPSIVMC